MRTTAELDSESEPKMRHAAFYCAIGFAVTGFLMLAFTVITLATRTLDPWNAGVLTFTMILPFVVSVLSWREWGRLQKATAPIEEDKSCV
jgi:cytochrome bd-type quinol oxidase subunit 1